MGGVLMRAVDADIDTYLYSTRRVLKANAPSLPRLGDACGRAPREGPIPPSIGLKKANLAYSRFEESQVPIETGFDSAR
jgi:hypothetical protein